MEYHMPSQFDQNGFNILSPSVQSLYGGVGYQPTPQPFTYNGENPYLTYLENQKTYNDYCQLGADASSYLQQAQQIALAPQQQQTSYNPVYGYYNDNYMQQQDFGQLYGQMYATGQMNLTDYCYYNNGGINRNQTNNSYYQSDPNDDWYGYATRSMQKRQLEQEEYEREYNNQIFAWKACSTVADNYYKRDESETVGIENKIAYFNKLNAYRQACAQDEYQMDCFSNFMRSLPRSTDPGYVSPAKAEYVAHWNNYYKERNDKYPENYTVDDYFNKGIMNDMIIELYAHDAKLNEKKMKAQSLFSREKFKQILHQQVPSYDPVSETGLIFNTTIGGRVSDIEIHLPEHLARDQYTQRKIKFMDTIFADNRSNLKGAI